jgi:hypothetical protein
MGAIVYPVVWVAPAVLIATISRPTHRAEGLWWTLATAAAAFLVMTGAFRASGVALGLPPQAWSILEGPSLRSSALVLLPLLALAAALGAETSRFMWLLRAPRPGSLSLGRAAAALAGMSALVLASTIVQVNDILRLLSGYEPSIRVNYAQRVALVAIAAGLTATAIAVVSGAGIAYLRAGRTGRIWGTP